MPLNVNVSTGQVFDLVQAIRVRLQNFDPETENEELLGLACQSVCNMVEILNELARRQGVALDELARK
jgi:hypothetical protein